MKGRAMMSAIENKQVDVLVIGGGVMGSSIAYHVARAGGQALVVERAEVAVEPVASWASAGGVRRQGRHAAEAMLASEAIARWPMLEDELQAAVQFRQGGNLLLAESNAEGEQLAAFVQQQHACGFMDVRLLDRKEVLEKASGLNERVVAGSYSPADGQADPALTTRAFAEAARRYGAMYWTRTACKALRRENGRVTGALTERGFVGAEQVVLAAGAWSDELAATVGLRLPIKTLALQMIRSTAAAPGLLRPVLSAVERALSLKQLSTGEFLLGGGWPGDSTPDRQSYALRQASLDGNWAAACGLLPVVGGQRIERAWCGLEAESFDGLPFIGPVPGLQGLVLALGFSGHGFALSPAVGRCVADLLAGKTVPELALLEAGRIGEFDAVEVVSFLNDIR